MYLISIGLIVRKVCTQGLSGYKHYISWSWFMNHLVGDKARTSSDILTQLEQFVKIGEIWLASAH